MDLLTGKGPSKRHELFYFGGPQLGAVRLDDFKFQFYPAAARLARAEGHDRHARHGEHPPGSVRADAVDQRRNAERPGRRLHERFLRPRVLAVRARPAAGRQAREDGHRLSADAGPGLLQPGRGEEADRRHDQGPRRPVSCLHESRRAADGGRSPIFFQEITS